MKLHKLLRYAALTGLVAIVSGAGDYVGRHIAVRLRKVLKKLTKVNKGFTLQIHGIDGREEEFIQALTQALEAGKQHERADTATDGD